MESGLPILKNEIIAHEKSEKKSGEKEKMGKCARKMEKNS